MEENKQEKKELSQEERVECLKTIFSTLEVEVKAEFTQWCHEEIEKGLPQLVGQKLQKANEKFNSFIAKASDSLGQGAKSIYDNTNKLFESKEKPEEEDIKKTSESGHSFFS